MVINNSLIIARIIKKLIFIVFNNIIKFGQ